MKPTTSNPIDSMNTNSPLAPAKRSGGIRGMRFALSLAAAAAVLLSTNTPMAGEQVPFKGVGWTADATAEEVPDALVVPPSEYPAPITPNHFVLPLYYQGQGLNSHLGKYRVYMVVYIHIPWNENGQGVWIRGGGGINVTPDGDLIVWEWPLTFTNPATYDATSGTAIATGGTGRFEGVEGFLEWTSWEDPESGLRHFRQEGLISSTGSLRRK